MYFILVFSRKSYVFDFGIKKKKNPENGIERIHGKMEIQRTKPRATEEYSQALKPNRGFPAEHTNCSGLVTPFLSAIFSLFIPEYL